MTNLISNNRAAIVYQPGMGYMVVTFWMNGTGGGRFKGDHASLGNESLPMLSVQGFEIYPDNDEGKHRANEHCMFLNDKGQL